MRQVIARIVEESGFAGLYVGLWPQLTNAMLKEAMLIWLAGDYESCRYTDQGSYGVVRGHIRAKRGTT